MLMEASTQICATWQIPREPSRIYHPMCCTLARRRTSERQQLMYPAGIERESPRGAEAIRRDYDNLWARCRSKLAQGLIEPDPASEETLKRWGVSVILRPEADVADTLSEVASELAVYTGRRQVVYDRSNLHTTMRSVEFNLGRVDDERICAYGEVLRELAKSYDPLRINYRGLTATATGVLAQGWPADESLQELRRDFRRRLAHRGLAGGPEETKLRLTAHASLTVFAGPLLNPLSLVRYVKDNRDTEYGTATYRCLDLVRYDRTPYDVRVVPMVRIPLGN